MTETPNNNRHEETEAFEDTRVEGTEENLEHFANVEVQKIFERLIDPALERITIERETALTKAKTQIEIQRLTDYFDIESDRVYEVLGKMAEEIYHANRESGIDQKTGLFRLEAFTKLYEYFTEKRMDDEYMVMICFDLDKFKMINETLGHTGGDEILKEVAKIIRENTRTFDAACRPGGDEFIVMLNKVKDTTLAVDLAKRLGEELSKIKIGGNVNLGISIGFTIIPAKSNPTEAPYYGEVIPRADIGSGISKKLGGNRITAIEDGQYSVYELRDGKYTLAKTGDISDFEEQKEAVCLHQIKVALQRYFEEIGENKNALDDLTIKELAKLLFEARQRKELKK